VRRGGPVLGGARGEKGDGDLTDEERRTLEACPRTTVVTIPGTSCFISNDEPEIVAGLLVEALGHAAEHKSRQSPVME
jgi:hypothetical protein